MRISRIAALLAVAVLALPASAAGLTGQYIEARTCDVWTGPCFANADFNLAGKNAVMAWKIKEGSVGDVQLDGLSVVAVIAAQNTLGMKQSAPARVVLIVDRKANASQREALIQLAQRQGGALFGKILAVHASDIDLTICDCKGQTCAELKTAVATVKTRCLNAQHDKVCGNESAYHPPLSESVHAVPAAVEEHSFSGAGLGETWRDFDRRGAYVGTFNVR